MSNPLRTSVEERMVHMVPRAPRFSPLAALTARA
jgi:hypothetical protein